MKLWKGIAIAGIWAGLGFAVWAGQSNAETMRTLSLIGSICACIATCCIAGAKE